MSKHSKSNISSVKVYNKVDYPISVLSFLSHESKYFISVSDMSRLREKCGWMTDIEIYTKELLVWNSKGKNWAHMKWLKNLSFP